MKALEVRRDVDGPHHYLGVRRVFIGDLLVLHSRARTQIVRYEWTGLHWDRPEFEAAGAVIVYDATWMRFSWPLPCWLCGGLGSRNERECKSCRGDGVVVDPAEVPTAVSKNGGAR